MTIEIIPSLGQVIFTLVTFYSLKLAYSWYAALSDSNKSPKLHQQNWKKDVVYLYQFPRPSYLPNLSPFCLKIEAFLRLHSIKYEVMPTLASRSKKGRVPFIELNGEQIADSQLIIFYLEKYFKIKDILSEEQKSIERAFYRMIESSFFNGANWFKMKCNEAEFAGAILELQFGKSYDFLKRILAPYFKFQFTERYVIEGTGKHSDEEVLNILRSDLRAIETYLGDKDFFFGENSSLIDIVIFSHVAAIYYVRYNHLAKDLIDSEFPTILNHTQKVAKKFFSEFKFGKE